jgi:single-stranded DNA-binding protein
VGRHNHGSQSGRGLVKGSLVYTEGRLETRKYEKDGQEKSRTEIIINQLLMLDNKAASTKDAAASTNGHASKPSDHPDDLPDMEFSEEEASSENIPY